MHDAQTQHGQTNLFLRNDTMLGVCEAIGRDFGFNPDWLRVALAAGLLWNPLAMFGIYLGLGVVVAASRLAFPASSRAAAPQPAVAPQSAATEPETQEQLLSKAEQEPELIAA